MILRRFYDEKLAQASYLVGCAATGEALVVDANRDVEQYISAAEAEGLQITHVTETHIHADYVSGSRELADRTGARLYLSDEGGESWKYAFAAEADAVLLHDGDTFKVGNVRVEAVHTPGHTPEHMTFVITDTAGADRPMGAFTGDFIFVGDVGRPDLLERAAKFTGTMEDGARVLYGSLRSFVERFPDFLQIWPGHGAGSACGKALGAVPQSTLGYEKLFNWGLNVADEAEFVRAVLADQPEPPMYFAEMKRINKEGPAILGTGRGPRRLSAARLARVAETGALLVDTRPAADFGAAHVPGSINVPLGRSFTTWAGSVLPFDRDLYVVVSGGSRAVAEEVARDLSMIGLDRVVGYFTDTDVRSWIEENGAGVGVREMSATELSAAMRANAVELIDVRNSTEWNEAHIEGSRNLPLGRLPELLDRIPRDRPVVVHCHSGGRAAVAIGLLQRNGFGNVAHLEGDLAGWLAEDRPIQKGPGLSSAA